MRKLVITFSTLVGLIFLIGVLMPFAMGFWVKNNYPEILSAATHTPHISFQIVEFKRGWFQSRAALQVTINSTQGLTNGSFVPLAQFTIHQKIQHGPLINVKSNQQRNRWVIARAYLKNESHDKNLDFKAKTLWTMANGWKTHLIIHHILLGNAKQRIEANQLKGDINFTYNDHHFQTDMTLGDITFYQSNPEAVENNIIELVKVFEVQGLMTHLDIHKINYLWYGNRHFLANKILVFPYNGSPLVADNWQVDITQSQEKELSHLKLVNSVEKISDEQLKIDQLQVVLNLRNMNSQVLENLAQVLMNAYDLQRFKLYPLIVDLFSKGVTIDLSQFQFMTEDGPVNLQAQIFSPKNKDTELGLMHLLENIHFQASANLPRAWLQKNLISYYQSKKTANPQLKIDPAAIANHYLNYWVDHHFLVSEQKQLTMAVNYKEGDLLINGEKPVLSNIIIDDSLSDIHE